MTFLHDGAERIDNNLFNLCERPLRSIGLGGTSWLVGGSNEGARCLAVHQTLLFTAQLVGIRDPWEYLRDVLLKLSRGWPHARPSVLLPKDWLAARNATK